MDPDQTLADIRRLASDILEASPEGALEYGEELAEKVQALDEWIQQGGFLPSAWARTP